MITAYVRVSTTKQDVSNQKYEIARYALSKQITINRWVIETVSGTVHKKDRSLNDLLAQLKKGDTLLITEISRLSRALIEILSIMEECAKKGINVYSVKDGFTFDNSINSTVLLFAFGLVAEIERKLISQRTKAALANKKAEGVILGRPEGSSPQLEMLLKHKETVNKMIQQDRSIKDICEKYNVSRSSFSRFRAKYLMDQ